jgi:DNA-binding protein YbaB
MFNKLKQIKDLRSQAKKMQNVLADESITVDKNGIKLTMNGNLEVTSIEIPDNMSKDSIQTSMKDAINEAVKKTQRIMAQKMKEMGGFPGM